MQRPRGFTLIEVLIAVVVLGVGVLGVVAHRACLLLPHGSYERLLYPRAEDDAGEENGRGDLGAARDDREAQRTGEPLVRQVYPLEALRQPARHSGVAP